jgi:hypothetical protein
VAQGEAEGLDRRRGWLASADQCRGAGTLSFVIVLPHCCPSRTPAPYSTFPPVSLLTELDAFYTDHRLCGDLDSGVDGPIVWIACPCGASMARRAYEGERTCLQGLTRPIVPTWTAAASC